MEVVHAFSYAHRDTHKTNPNRPKCTLHWIKETHLIIAFWRKLNDRAYSDYSSSRKYNLTAENRHENIIFWSHTDWNARKRDDNLNFVVEFNFVNLWSLFSDSESFKIKSIVLLTICIFQTTNNFRTDISIDTGKWRVRGHVSK